MCPGLQRLNIGQVPKVNSHSLTVMTSQLKSLIALNLTGLQAVSFRFCDRNVESFFKAMFESISEFCGTKAFLEI